MKLAALGLAFAAFATGYGSGVASAQEGYLLGPSDKLRLAVAEWRPAQGTTRDWSALAGEYRVGPDGYLALPYLGRMKASGRAAHEIAAEIGPLLRSTLGLDGEPSAALEIIEYRPIFVTGDVREPGMFPYVPGMNVAKALAIAGGLRQPESEAEHSSDRAYIQSAGQLELKRTERASLAARLARLQAEASGSTTIDFPQTLRDHPSFKELERGEIALLKARRDRLERQKVSLTQLRSLLERELESLETKVAFQIEQRDAVRKELAGVRKLARKGLAANNRIRGVSQALAQIETNILNIESERFRARQDLNKTERDLLALEDEREAEVAALLQETEVELLANEQGAMMLRSLALDARAAASATATPNGLAPVLTFKVTRGVDDPKTVAVERTSSIEPGDVVDVSVVLADLESGSVGQ